MDHFRYWIFGVLYLIKSRKKAAENSEEMVVNSLCESEKKVSLTRISME